MLYPAIVFMLIIVAKLAALGLMTLRYAVTAAHVQQLADEGRLRDAEIWEP